MDPRDFRDNECPLNVNAKLFFFFSGSVLDCETPIVHGTVINAEHTLFAGELMILCKLVSKNIMFITLIYRSKL